MLAPYIGEPLDNLLLSHLPFAEFGLLAPHMSSKQIAQGTVLLEAGDETDYVYFPDSGMLSLLIVLNDGISIETSTVGREGVVGAMGGLGLYTSHVRVVVQLPMGVTTITASAFRKVARGSPVIRDLCVRYNDVLLLHARTTAACNAVHHVEARFCRWLLQSADRAQSDVVPLTQDFIAQMLGVRRTSVTDVASKIQKTGAISYSRGLISIHDRPGLERMSCECYRALQSN